ncbi:thiamine pyrophosphokinase [Ruegeria sp. ANG-R]|uniref:thiamine diphosphokinase n=1 Tax=Ruegeria sp. ANG-R TaxID=1577903 RepID=UPI00057D4183|nr:thiamine diphosphokinase [Ruegeria sp. ANG-R]KIC42338.1 thiamine pyrophosphokinase [Ruegeria sp. ANG-R]
MVNLVENGAIVRSGRPIGLFGGGEISSEDVNLVLSRVTSAVAADSGAAALIDSGQIPDVVIGDFDSLAAEYRAQIPDDRLFPIHEQDSTDFDKALRSISAPVVLAAGFLGARVDHQLVAFNTLTRLQDRPCILLGACEIVFHTPPRINLELAAGETVSLFPLRRVTGRSDGLEWPIDDLVLEPDGRVGTSNRALGAFTLEVDGPGLLTILPRTALDQVTQAFLSGQTGRWPARAG